MVRFEEIIIFGCGGVGSWVAEFVVRNKMTNVLSLVDFDNVEEKNLSRQNFNYYDISASKVDCLKTRIKNLQKEDSDDYIDILVYSRRVLEDIDLRGFNSNSIAIITTDNVSSKRTIAQHFDRYIIVNCDKNFVELKNFLDNTDLNAWDLGGGYSNRQDIISNLFSANLVIFALKHYGSTFFDRKFHFCEKVENYMLDKTKRC